MIKFEDISVDKSAPFSSDLLDIPVSCEQFVSLIEQINTSYVLGLSGLWGTGKTIFLKSCQVLLNQLENKHVIYFSAWETDWTEEPFNAIVSEILEYLSSHSEFDEDKKLTFTATINKIKAVALPLLGGLITKSVDHLSYGLISVEALTKEIVENYTTGTKIAQFKLDGYRSAKSAVIDLKKILQDFSTSLGNGGQVIIIIDELDRCRPNYAIQLLERIKHFFSDTGIVFVLCYNKLQLVESVKHIYGINTDAELYLKRFIEREIPYTIENSNYAVEYIKKNSLVELFVPFVNSSNYYPSVISKTNTFFNQTIRQQQFVLSHLYYYYQSFIATKFNNIHILYIIISLLHSNKILFNKLTTAEYTIEEIPVFFSCPAEDIFLVEADMFNIYLAQAIGCLMLFRNPSHDFSGALKTNLFPSHKGFVNFKNNVIDSIAMHRQLIQDNGTDILSVLFSTLP